MVPDAEVYRAGRMVQVEAGGQNETDYEQRNQLSNAK